MSETYPEYDQNSSVIADNPFSNASGIVGSMADSASQFGEFGDSIFGVANQYAQSKGGWGNTISDAAQGYVDNHGGIAGTSSHLGHEALNVAANTLWGAKDWGKAFRAAKEGRWGDAATSAAWGLAAAGATASMVVPGAGEAIKGTELAAQAARAGVKAGAELAAKDGGEAVAKDVVETGVKEEGSTTAEKIRKGERKAHLANDVLGLHLPNIGVGPGQQETYTRSY